MVFKLVFLIKILIWVFFVFSVFFINFLMIEVGCLIILLAVIWLVSCLDSF